MPHLLRLPCYFFCISLLLIGCEPEEEKITLPIAKGHKILEEVIISSATPLAMPQVILASELNKAVAVENNNFRPVLDEIQLFDGSTEIDGEVLIAEDNLSASFVPDDMLSAKKEYELKATAHWEREVNGGWVTVGEIGTESIRNIFNTTDNPLPLNDVFSEVFPLENAVSESVVSSPRATFNYALEEEIKFSGNNIQVRLVFDHASMKQGSNTIETTVEINEAMTHVNLIPKVILQGLTEYAVTVQLHWEIQRPDKTWKVLLKDGEAFTHTKQFSFTTKALGNTSQILPDNIDYTYPIARQYHFLKLEHNQGSIKLKTPLQNELFQTTGMQLKVRFTTPDQEPLEVSATFDAGTYKLTYAIPSSLLNETIYKLELLRVGNSEEVLHALHFRTSMYNTFLQKINAGSFSQLYAWQLEGGIHELYSVFAEGIEGFDIAETDADSIEAMADGAAIAAGLIQADLLPESDYYQDVILPKIYGGYKKAGLTIDRDTTQYGIPPMNGNYIYQTGARELSASEITNNSSSRISDLPMIRCTVAAFFAWDWMLLRNEAANHPDRETNAYMKDLTDNHFPNISGGNYIFRLKYVLPGGEITSEVEKTMTRQ
jgi:hypothetical protein